MMIRINGREYQWHDGMDLYDVFKLAGYTLKKPSVLVHVDGEVVRNDDWDSFKVSNGSSVELVNLLRGG